MPDMFKLLDTTRKTAGCTILPPVGLPTMEPSHTLPEDVRTFYSLCGGAILHAVSPYSVTLVGPEDFVLANSKILIGFSEEALAAAMHEISGSWYIIGGYDNTEYICIDCNPLRLGRCYYSFWDRHGMQGYSPIIALSFTELLERLLQARGEEPYWEQEGFVSYGDAYDDVVP